MTALTRPIEKLAEVPPSEQEAWLYELFDGPGVPTIPQMTDLFLNRFYDDPDHTGIHTPFLAHYEGRIFEWSASRWNYIPPAEVKAALWFWAKHVHYPSQNRISPYELTPAKTNDLYQGLLYSLRPLHHGPCWLTEPSSSISDARYLVTFSNGIYDPLLDVLHPPTSEFFEPFPITTPFIRDAVCPKWLDFVSSASNNDPIWINLLQEFIGYCLLPTTELERWGFFYGRPRAGKTLILDVLRSFRDEAASGSLELHKLAGEFAASPFLGKRLLITDETPTKIPNASVAETFLLRVIGNGRHNVSIKYRDAVDGAHIPAKVIMASNSLPRFSNVGNSLFNKLLPIEFKVSHEGNENPSIKRDILKEKAGIAVWAMEGARRLLERGHFVLPESSAELLRTYQLSANPLLSFVYTRCTLGPNLSCTSTDLYREYCNWCDENDLDDAKLNDVWFARTLLGESGLGLSKVRKVIGGTKITTYQGLTITT